MRHAMTLALVLALTGCSKPAPAPEPVRAVRTLTITAQSGGGTSEYSGEVRARSESRLSFRVGGKVLERVVDLGDQVKAGQPLVKLDPQDLRLAVQTMRAALAAAQAAHDQVDAEYRRYKELFSQGFIGAAELDRRESAVKTARAQLNQAKAQADMQGNQARYATLVADAGGVITGVDVEPGMVVSAGAPVLRLAHDGPRDIVFAVPEDRVGVLKTLEGQPGHFSVRIWGAPPPALPATIREIAAAADPVTRTFAVKAAIGNTATGTSAAGVRLGQTATVEMALPRIEGVIKLPLSAVREDGGGSAVWLLDPASMTVRSQSVTLGGIDGTDVIVTEGLKSGQTVVTAGVHVLNPGQSVTRYVEPGSRPAAAASASGGARPGVQ